VSATGATPGLTLSWYSAGNWLYAVQFATNLVETNPWADFPGGTNLPGLNAVRSLTDNTIKAAPARFYRVIAY
jgi:hypothetical protein